MKKTLLFGCLLALSGFAFAQTDTMQDRISDESRYEPKPGANVFI